MTPPTPPASRNAQPRTTPCLVPPGTVALGVLLTIAAGGCLPAFGELQVVNSRAALEALVPSTFATEDFESYPVDLPLTGEVVELLEAEDSGITVSARGASDFHRIGVINFGDAGIDSLDMIGNFLIGRAEADVDDVVRIDFPSIPGRHHAVAFDYSGATGGQGAGVVDGALFKYRITTGDGKVTESNFPADDGFIGFFDPVCPIASIEFLDTEPNSNDYGEGWAIDNLMVSLEALPDSDGDGMSDLYERAIDGLDENVPDGDGDLDEDTLTNVEESRRCTDPNDADTDGDGFPDAAESGTGVFVDASNPGTSPTRADTDGDGIGDAAETNTGTYVDENDTGTNPNAADTDGDGFPDGTDPDPLDASVFPSVLFGGGAFMTTHVWNAGTVNDLFTAELLTAEDSEEGERITVETPRIHFHDNTPPPAFVEESRPYPLWDPDNGGPGFGDNDDFAIRSVGQINIRPPGGLVTFVCNSDDGFALRIDGIEIGSAGNRGRANTIMTADLAPGLHELEFIHWERGGGAGVSFAVLREFDAAAPPLFVSANETSWELVTAYDSTGPLRITEVGLTEDGLAITWPSNAGDRFVIEQSENLEQWLELDDSYPGDTDATTFEAPLPDPRPARFYLRVKKAE